MNVYLPQNATKIWYSGSAIEGVEKTFLQPEIIKQNKFVHATN